MPRLESPAAILLSFLRNDMSESASIQKMSHKHEAILNYIIANPTIKLGDVAGHFEVTFAWLSTIIHSHAFQDQLQRRHDELFDSHILQDLGDKLNGAAHASIDAYLEKVPNLTADQLISANDKILGRLGYGARAPAGGNTFINGNVTQNVQHNHVSKDVLEGARNRIGSHKVGETSSQAALPDKSADKGIEAQGSLVRTEDQQRIAG